MKSQMKSRPSVAACLAHASAAYGPEQLFELGQNFHLGVRTGPIAKFIRVVARHPETQVLTVNAHVLSAALGQDVPADGIRVAKTFDMYNTLLKLCDLTGFNKYETAGPLPGAGALRLSA